MSPLNSYSADSPVSTPYNFPISLMPYTATIIAKESQGGHARVAISFSDGQNSFTEYLVCTYPVASDWLEQKCAQRIKELGEIDAALNAVKPGKVVEAPVPQSVEEPEPVDTSLTKFLEALEL